MQRASLALWIVIALLAPSLPPASAQEPPAVVATQVPLSPLLAGLHGVGKLTFRGGLQLTSADPDFGGWSDLFALRSGRRLVAIGDRGRWMTADLRWDARGDLVGFALEAMGPLRDETGAPLQARERMDAEALAPADPADPAGGWLVAFEHDHRLWRYAPDLDAPAVAVGMPPAMENADAALANKGMEAMARLADGSLSILLEGASGGDETTLFRQRGAAWEAVPYLRADGFQVTGAAPLMNGALLVLERFYSPETGPKARLRFLNGADLARVPVKGGHLLAELALPLTVDNFEGVAAFTAPSGALMVLLLSDDNFNPTQRTLLLAFELTLD